MNKTEIFKIIKSIKGYQTSLKHDSYDKRQKNSNKPFQKYEFLGDRVLGLVISEYLINNFLILQPYNNYIELVYCFIEIDKNLEEFTMEVFKTLDIRGLSFFKAYQLASEEFKRIKKNGILELIVDKQKNFTEDFSKWAKSQGGKIFDIEDDHRMVRLFIRKGSRVAKV